MPEAWIPLVCPDCGAEWEDSPADLPEPGTEFVCTECRTSQPTIEFVKTRRGLDILREFHAE